MDNATPQVGTMLASCREYCARLHAQSRLLSSELVTTALACPPAFANFVAALRITRRQQLTAEAADLLANMLGRAGADIVNVAIQMVIVCGQAWMRLNGPLAAPMTANNCPLDDETRIQAGNFWHEVLIGQWNGGALHPAGTAITAALVTNGAQPELDNWVVANEPGGAIPLQPRKCNPCSSDTILNPFCQPTAGPRTGLLVLVANFT